MTKKQMYEGLALLEMLAACRRLNKKEDLTLKTYRAMSMDKRIRKEFKKPKDVRKAVAIMSELNVAKSWEKTQEMLRNEPKPTQ